MHPLLQMPWDAATILRKKKKIRRELMEKPQAVNLRIAVLGGSTTQDLVRILELFLLDIGICPTFYESEYGQWYEEACFDTLALAEFKPQIVYFHTSFANLPLPDTNADLETLAKDVFQRYCSAWQALSNRYGCTIIQNNFEEPYLRNFGNLDATQGLTAYVAKMNGLFADYAREHREFFLQDIHYLASVCGLASWHDREIYHLYKLVPGYEALPCLAHNLAMLIGAILGRSRKCLVLDLDNTLWGGVIGDDGLGGIQLGHETAAGEGYAEFQAYVKELSKRGVVLAVCSKNEDSIAKEGFTHPDSLLKVDDFASFQEQSEYTDEEIIETIKACKSYGFIKGSPYSQIWLTETGRDIVLERQQPKQQPAFTFNIQEMHGNNQVGSNNIQNITVDNAIKCLLEKIDTSHVPESTKSEARGLLQRFMEHPIIAPLVSSVLASTLGIKSAL